MSAKLHPLTNSRSILFFLGSGSSGGFQPFTRVLIILFAVLCALLLTWGVAPRVDHLATEAPMPVSMIQLLGQRFPSVAGQLTSSRAVERGDERVAGQLVTGFRMSQDENAPIAPAALLPVEKIAWEAAARRANSSAKVKDYPESREFSVFFPGSYDGPFVAVLGSQRVVLKAVGARPARGASREGRVEYAGAYQEVDSLHVPGAGQSEEFLLLRSAYAPVVFDYEVVETEGVAGIEVREGAVRFIPAAAPNAGSPFHSVESGALEIAKPWVVDAAGHRSASAVRWEIVRSRPGEVGGARLRLYVDATGLTYPLLVDPAFTAVGLMTSVRGRHTATLLPTGHVLITGGQTSSGPANTAELFDPASGKFTAIANMTLARAEHTATLLPSGQVLITGGITGGSVVTNRAELFDPGYGTFTGLFPNNLTSPRANHTATLLKNGQVLIAGGETGSGGTNTAELFDPASRTFTSIPRGTMNSTRYAHTATLLSTGSVLIAGGVVSGIGYTNTAELYDPFFGGFASLSPNTMTSDRGYHTATLLGSGQVLIAGGFAGSGVSNTAELFDPVSETFTSLSPSTMTSPRQNHTATLLPSGKVLLTGGVTNLSGAVTNTAELFDPTSGNFYSLSPSTMISARRDHTATLLTSGSVLIAGGLTAGSAATNTAELYDPTSGTFTSYKSATTSAVAHHSATSLPDGKILIAGGSDGNAATNTADLFDPASGTFTATSSTMTSARTSHTTTLLLSGQVLLAGGGDANGGTTNTAELFDPALRNFTSLSPNSTMTSARRSHTATLLSSGKVLLAGGDVNGSVTNTAELFDPVSAIFTATPNMTSARRYHTATLLPSGKILLAGGDVNGSVTNTAELFDPASGIFTATPNMTSPRGYHTATLLPNGQVLLAGGDVNGAVTNTAELFDPASGTFTATLGTMAWTRVNHTATLLPGGTVLIAGGRDGSAYRNTAELFNPATETFTPLSPNNTMTSVRYFHTATLLTNGQILIAGGGDANGGTTNTAEAFDLGLGFSDARRPVLSTVPNSLVQPASLVLSGTGFQGDSEGSGSSVNNSATNYPVLQLMRIDNEQTFFPLSNSATNWSDTAFSSGTLGSVTPLPRGYYRVTIFTNAIPSFQKIINIGSQPTTLGNISTRLGVETGDNVLIGGFIITGTQPKKVIVRAIGPSLPLAGALADPVLELHGPGAFATMTNDNWRSDQEAEIIATTIPPINDLESAIVATLPANNSAYTAIVRGLNNGTGIGVVEAYDLDRTVDSKLANISTRGLVQTGDNVLIGGLIMAGPDPLRVIVRAIGPSLPLPGALGDPTLELRDGDGALIAFNDNWRSDQEAEIIATTIPPTNDLESAIVRNLLPGSYTAIVRGANDTAGVAVVEVYGLLPQ